jgi:hypothetical protein
MVDQRRTRQFLLSHILIGDSGSMQLGHFATTRFSLISIADTGEADS